LIALMTPSTQVRQVRSVPARESLVTASLPLLRASAFAAIAVPASLVGHLAGGGGIPDEATLLLAVALVIVVYRVALAARERSWPVITLALAGAEFAVHVLFDTGGANTGWPGPTAIAPGTPAMNMSAMIAGHADAGSGLLMMAGHAGAVVLLGWVLRRGERVLWSMARRATIRAHDLLRPLLAAGTLIGFAPTVPRLSHRRGPVPASDRGHRCFRTTGGVLWRGPPLGRNVAA
jgi:hypothetical protein